MEFPSFSNFDERKKRRLLRVRDMLAPRALAVSVVCALCLQRDIPNSRLSLKAKPSATGANSHHPGEYLINALSQPPAQHAQHTRTPLHPAALASVPYGVVLVRVRVSKTVAACKPQMLGGSTLLYSAHVGLAHPRRGSFPGQRPQSPPFLSLPSSVGGG